MGVRFDRGTAYLTRWDAAEYVAKSEKGLRKLKAIGYFFRGITVYPADVSKFINKQKACNLVKKLHIRDINYQDTDD